MGSLTVGDTGGSPDSPILIDSGTSGSLTFQTSGGNATLTTTSVGTSSSTPVTNTISAPIIFNSNTTINPGNLGSSGQASRIWLTGPISGSGNITVTGSVSGTSRSTLMLSGDNSSYTGNWTLSGTTGSTLNSGAGISIINDNNLGAVPGSPSTNITVTAGDNSALRFNAAVTLNANRNIEVQSGGRLTLIQDSTHTSTINGIISGDGGVTTNGGSSSNKKVRLSGDNTYTGSTTISSGTLALSSTGSIASTTIAFGVTDAANGLLTTENLKADSDEKCLL